MLVAREKETEKLNELYESASSELVALYGRRRAGKTFLIEEVFSGRITFRYAALSSADDRAADSSGGRILMKEQLKAFYRSLRQMGMRGSSIPQSWLEAFHLLGDFLQDRDDGHRQLVVLDEIQLLDTPGSGFMAGLEAFWNEWACPRSNLMVIACSSSISWIQDKMLTHQGLCDRVTCQIRLMPFTLHECERYYCEIQAWLSRVDIARSYMMVGGIPYYLQFLDRRRSLPQNVNALLLSGSAPLKEEYDSLLSFLFVKPDVYKPILEALSTKHRGMTRQELLAATDIQDSGELPDRLKALLSEAFIMEYSSYGDSKREIYYKLTDPFCLFYLTFVKPGGETSSIKDKALMNAWRKCAFENMCLSHIRQLKAGLKVSGVSMKEALWTKRKGEEEADAQIVLIIERDDHVINMCEIKYSNGDFIADESYHLALKRRRELLWKIIPEQSVIHNTLITPIHMSRNQYFSDFRRILNLSDLFGA